MHGWARRVGLAFELSHRMRELAIAGIQARNPGLSLEAARRVLWRQLLGEELFLTVFPEAAAVRS